MKSAVYPPSDLLKPYVKEYRVIESQEEMTNRILPGTAFAVAFRFKGQTSYLTQAGRTPLPVAMFSGLRRSARLIQYASESGCLIVQFTETGAPAFFPHAIHELFEESISLDHFLPHSEVSLLEERLAEAINNTERIAVIEQVLYEKLSFRSIDQLVLEAVSTLYKTNGMIRMKELAAHLHISQDAFEKRFRKVTGATPKQFAFIVKMKGIIQKKSASSSFLDLSLDNGYYDQPHFNKDFKLFTGLTPTDFFKSGKYW